MPVMELDPNILAIKWLFSHDPEVSRMMQTALHDKIETMARNYARRCQRLVDQEDLYQAGMIGAIVKAMNKYTPDAGDFEPYAMRFARGEMLHYIRDSSLTIKIPGSVKEAGWKITRYLRAYREEYGEDPSHEDIADALGLSMERVEHCMAINQRPKNLEPLDDWHQTPTDIYGQAPSFDYSETSSAKEIYQMALQMRASGMTRMQIARELCISKKQAITLLTHIDAEL